MTLPPHDPAFDAPTPDDVAFDGSGHRSLDARDETRLPRTDDRGDVPGWVLITLMTAGLVIALWAVAGPALAEVFDTAMQRVLSVG